MKHICKRGFVLLFCMFFFALAGCTSNSGNNASQNVLSNLTSIDAELESKIETSESNVNASEGQFVVTESGISTSKSGKVTASSAISSKVTASSAISSKVSGSGVSSRTIPIIQGKPISSMEASSNMTSKPTAKKSIKVLSVGNSFSQNAMEAYLWDIFRSAGYDEVILAYLYIGGCSLDTHWNNIKGNKPEYRYSKNSTGRWVHLNNQTVLSGLTDENWDVITVQQVSQYSGLPDKYTHLSDIVTWINQNKTISSARIYFHMTWAYSQNSDHSGYVHYNNDQMTMYNSIVSTTKAKVLPLQTIEGVIPAGTAIQNARTSVIGDDFTKPDGYHLNSAYGQYTAALTWFSYLSGEKASSVTYRPDIISSRFAPIAEGVDNAIRNPYSVTKSAYQS